MWGIKIELYNGEKHVGYYATEYQGIFKLDTREGEKKVEVSNIKKGYQWSYGKICEMFKDGKRVNGKWRKIGGENK